MNNYSINSEDDGDIVIAGDVISGIAYEAACKVSGISKFLPFGKSSLLPGRAAENASKFVKVSTGEDGIKLKFRVVVNGSRKVTDVITELQKTVKNSVQDITGRAVSSVNIVVSDAEIAAEDQSTS